MNIRRKNRLWIACAVLAGLALTIGLVLYALRSNIDLFYTPGEILYGKRETQQMPEVGQRLRVGGMVMQHRAILRGVAQQRAREARLRAAQQQEAA